MSTVSTTDDQYDALKDWASGAAQKIGLAVLITLVVGVCAGAAVLTSSLRPAPGTGTDMRSDAAISAAVQAALDHVHATQAAGAGGLDVDETGVPVPMLKLQSLDPQTAYQINAGVPFSNLPSPAAQPFVLKVDSPVEQARALDCLTAAVYYEAANESDLGQRAVAQVVLNRMRHRAYPKSVCAVVFQGSNQSTGCQFTFACDGSLRRKPNPALWARAQRVASAALNGSVMAGVGNATHYHTVFVAPYWMPGLVKITRIGAHIFYRWDGSWGAPRAFAGEYAGDEASAMPAKAGDLATPIAIQQSATAEVITPEAKPAQPLQLAAAPTLKPVAAAAPPTTVVAANTVTAPPRPVRLATPAGW